MRRIKQLTTTGYLLAVLVLSGVLTLPYVFFLGVPSPETGWIYLLAAWAGNIIAVILFVLILRICIRILSALFPGKIPGLTLREE